MIVISGLNQYSNQPFVDRATYAIINKAANERAAIAARALDQGKINYWNGQVNYWTGKVNAAKVDCGRKAYALRRAHGRRAISIARSRFNSSKRMLGIA